MARFVVVYAFDFLGNPVPPKLYTLSLPDALPICFGVVERGYIREGYWADLVLVDVDRPTGAANDQVLAKCGWTPFAGHVFGSSIAATFVSGQLAYHEGEVNPRCMGRALRYNH